MIDLRQSQGWGEYQKTRGWIIDTVKAANGKKILQVLIFQIGFWPWRMMKLQRNEVDPDFEDLRKLKKKHRVIQTVIEPLRIEQMERYKKAGFKRSRLPYLATKTVIIDLTKSEKELWKELSENARRLIKKNGDIKVETAEESVFHDLWRSNSKVWVLTKRELVSLLRLFGKDARLSVAKDKSGYHSGLLTLYTKDTANYFQTWTSELGRKSGAHYKLVWEEMLRAKKMGKKYFDFEGIYDPEFPINKWKGFTEFKKKFGGEVVTRPGCFTRWF